MCIIPRDTDDLATMRLCPTKEISEGRVRCDDVAPLKSVNVRGRFQDVRGARADEDLSGVDAFVVGDFLPQVSVGNCWILEGVGDGFHHGLSSLRGGAPLVFVDTQVYIPVSAIARFSGAQWGSVCRLGIQILSQAETATGEGSGFDPIAAFHRHLLAA